VALAASLKFDSATLNAIGRAVLNDKLDAGNSTARRIIAAIAAWAGVALKQSSVA
jgi:hypothetical protein